MKSLFKILIIYILRVLMRVLYVFPINDNRIVFNSYRGSQYSCNPKYLSEYIQKEYGKGVEIIWAFNNPKKFYFLKEKNIKIVKYNSLLRFYYEATAKVSINNIGSYSWFPIRKNQEHINTWHGGFNIKKVGLEECANNKLMKKSIKMSSELTTGLLSTSKNFDDIIAKRDLGYEKDTLKFGYPRNDILFKQKNGLVDLREKVCRNLGIKNSDYIVLYAPTYRYNTNKLLIHPNYDNIKTILSRITNKNVSVLCRMHHLMMNNLGDCHTVDATSYPDMQELLAVTDCLITDYSSSIWDYSIMQKPIFIYAPDYDEYDIERGFHVELDKLGFPFSKTRDVLEQQILEIDFEKASLIANEFREINNSYEKGTACEQTVNYLINKGLNAL